MLRSEICYMKRLFDKLQVDFEWDYVNQLIHLPYLSMSVIIDVNLSSS